MKVFFVRTLFFVCIIISFYPSAQPIRMDTANDTMKAKHLFIDVHQIGPGKVKYNDVVEAHAKDLQTQGKYNVEFIKYWVNEKKGLVFCLSSSSDSESIQKTHAEAHGLLANYIYEVTPGIEAALRGKKNLFLEVHYFGAGKLTTNDIAAAHKKVLDVQRKHGVRFINYWVDEKEGVVIYLSQANNSDAIIQTHKEADGFLPTYVLKVKQGR